MTKEIHCVTSKKTKKRCIKNKNQKLDLLLMQMFDFTYAGKCHIFLHTRFDKFELVVDGVHIVENIYCFSPHYKKYYQFEKLYTAIKAFNVVVQIITNNLDWFSPECFEGMEIYNELFITD